MSEYDELQRRIAVLAYNARLMLRRPSLSGSERIRLENVLHKLMLARGQMLELSIDLEEETACETA